MSLVLSSTNKTDRHINTEIFLQVTLFIWWFFQVLTRLVFSSSPVLYWYTAEIVSSDQRLKKESCTNKKHSYKNCDIINKISCFSSQNAQTKMIILYFMGYFIVGTFMFSNFLPWTWICYTLYFDPLVLTCLPKGSCDLYYHLTSIVNLFILVSSWWLKIGLCTTLTKCCYIGANW